MTTEAHIQPFLLSQLINTTILFQESKCCFLKGKTLQNYKSCLPSTRTLFSFADSESI